MTSDCGGRGGIWGEQPFSLQLPISGTFTSHLIQGSYLGASRAAWQYPVQKMEDEDGSLTAPTQTKPECGFEFTEISALGATQGLWGFLCAPFSFMHCSGVWP